MSPVIGLVIRAKNLPSVVNLIIIVNVIIALKSSNGLRLSMPPQALPQPPRIWLSEYAEEDSYYGVPAKEEFQTLSSFQNEFISKNGTEYVIEVGADLTVFTCQAKYPIKWTVPEMKQLINFPYYRISTTSIRISEFSPELEQPSNKYFRSFLALRYAGAPFFSVDFVCKALEGNSNEHDVAQSRIHIYISGSSQALEHEGETISISHDSNTDLILPCRPSVPDIPITLERQIGGDWKPFSNRLLSFDPQVGYIQKFNSRIQWGKKFVGMYKCSVSGSEVGREDDGVVLLNVTSDSDASTPPLTEFKSHLWMAKGKLASLTQETKDHRTVIKCCFGEFSAKNVAYFDGCDDQLQCDVLKATLPIMMEKGKEDFLGIQNWPIDNSTNCSKVRVWQSPWFGQCHGENLDYAGGFSRIFLPGVAYVANRTAAYLKNIFHERRRFQRSSLTTSQDIQSVMKAPLDQKIIILMGHSKDPSGEDTRSAHYSSVFLGRDITKSGLLETEYDVDDEKVDEIIEYNRNVYYEGEPLKVLCLGLVYFYTTEGAQLRLNWRNGTKNVLERDPSTGLTYVYFYGRAELRRHSDGVTHIFGSEVKAHLEMESVDCYMPLLDSSKWEKLTYQIQVKESLPPQFVGGEEDELVYLYLKDTEREISWEVMEGIPTPDITVTKDGKMLLSEEYELNFNRSDGRSLIAIRFPLVTYDLHGRYTCISKNVKGRAEKTIQVFIIEGKSSKAIAVSIICVTVASSLLIAIVVRFRIQLAQMWRLKRSRHL